MEGLEGMRKQSLYHANDQSYNTQPSKRDNDKQAWQAKQNAEKARCSVSVQPSHLA